MKSYRYILCATDFSPYCDRACIHAAKLAKESGAKLTLLHVVDLFAVDRSNEEIAPEDVDPKVFRRKHGSHWKSRPPAWTAPRPNARLLSAPIPPPTKSSVMRAPVASTSS